MRAHGWLRITQSSKTQFFYFLSPNPNSFFQTLISCLPSSQQRLEANLAGLSMLDQPRTLLPWWDPPPPGKEILVQTTEAACRSDRQYIPVWPVGASATRSFCMRLCSCVTTRSCVNNTLSASHGLSFTYFCRKQSVSPVGCILGLNSWVLIFTCHSSSKFLLT
jgi:hypothetical protein